MSEQDAGARACDKCGKRGDWPTETDTNPPDPDTGYIDTRTLCDGCYAEAMGHESLVEHRGVDVSPPVPDHDAHGADHPIDRTRVSRENLALARKLVEEWKASCEPNAVPYWACWIFGHAFNIDGWCWYCGKRPQRRRR